MELQEIKQQNNKRSIPKEEGNAIVNAGFFSLQSFELIQRVANAFSSSSLVPTTYQNNLPNCMIALDMAQRIGANPLMVMQNLYIVHGTPSWSSKFLIATINGCGRYSSLRYEWKGEEGQDNFGCRAWAIEKSTNERLDGIWITWKMVKAEGWSKKKGSKWLTMPEQMFVYRSAAFWQRAYAPELGMGLISTEEASDVYDARKSSNGGYEVNLSDLQDSNDQDDTVIDITPPHDEEKPQEVQSEPPSQKSEDEQKPRPKGHTRKTRTLE
ncbi:MAG: hypothetical protein JKY67_08345 [Pseudomonadales bacterium]|nr:hypothetical protein [Pseudomonadales bacterium]